MVTVFTQGRSEMGRRPALPLAERDDIMFLCSAAPDSRLTVKTRTLSRDDEDKDGSQNTRNIPSPLSRAPWHNTGSHLLSTQAGQGQYPVLQVGLSLFQC